MTQTNTNTPPEGYVPDERDTIVAQAKAWRDSDPEHRTAIVLLFDGVLTGITTAESIRELSETLEVACRDNLTFELAMATTSLKMHGDRVVEEMGT